jgi:hypothetical protein
LSLLRPEHDKLPEATLGVEAAKPEEVLRVVRQLLPTG